MSNPQIEEKKKSSINEEYLKRDKLKVDLLEEAWHNLIQDPMNVYLKHQTSSKQNRKGRDYTSPSLRKSHILKDKFQPKNY